MNLKQHNNIVQKLIEQIESKDKEITQLNKQLTQLSKTMNNQSNKTIQSTQTQKLIQKRITQLNKQHQAKLATLNQQIKTLTQQNLQLKQRVNLKTQLQYKQKQRIAQILKKNVDRKPGTKEDYKISALISHYENQINKKNTFIQTLKRQLKSLSLNSKQQQNSVSLSSKEQQLNTANNFKSSKQSVSSSTTTKSLKQLQQLTIQDEQVDFNKKKSVSITEHTKTIEKLNKEIQQLNNILKGKNTQMQQLKNNYNQLTKQYYRVVNQYGVTKQFNLTQKPIKNINNTNNNNKNNNNNNNTNSNNNNTNINNNNNNQNSIANKQFNIIKNPLLDKLKQPSQIITNQKDNHLISDTNFSFDLSQDLTNLNQDSLNDISVSITFQQNFKKFNNRPRIDLVQQQQEPYSHNQNHQLLQFNKPQRFSKNKQSPQQNNKYSQQLKTLISSILQLLSLTNKQQILPCLNDLTVKNSFIQINQQIINCLHEFLYKFGMGKVSKNQMIQVLTRFQDKCNKWIESNDLLDEICIQIGAKKHKIIQKINSFKSIQQQYLAKMRTPSFLTQLNRSQKLLQFINFFQLDKSNLQLPQQLKNIYQQLKYVDRFVKLANSILGIQIKDRKGLQTTLELILKKLQKYYSWEVQIEKENQRKTNKKKQKQKEKLKQTKQI